MGAVEDDARHALDLARAEARWSGTTIHDEVVSIGGKASDATRISSACAVLARGRYYGHAWLIIRAPAGVAPGPDARERRR